MNKKLKSLLKPYWYTVNAGFKAGFKAANTILLAPVRLSPVSSEKLGPPKAVVLSTEEWVKASHLKHRAATFTPVYPSHLVKRTPLENANKTVHWKIRQEYTRDLPASFVATIPSGRFCVNKGPIIDYTAVITPEDRLLGDVSSEFGTDPRKHSILSLWNLPSVHKIKGTAAILTSVRADIYFHWMCDLLPKLQLMRLANINLEDIDAFVVNANQAAFQKSTLEKLGIPAHKVIESTNYQHVKADMLIVPSLPSLPGNSPLWVSDFLRNTFLPTPTSPSLSTPKRIYISRDDTKSRRVWNEDQIVLSLAKEGIHKVELSKMSVAEQIALFSSVELIVAPHGAGLTNLMFCRPDTKVIEFFSPNYVNACYYALSSQLNLDYYYLIGEGKEPAEGVDPHFCGERITVNEAALLEVVKTIGVGIF